MPSGTGDLEVHCHLIHTELVHVVCLLGILVDVRVTKHLRYDDHNQNNQGHRMILKIPDSYEDDQWSWRW